jgi:hypothetical protein
MRRRPVRSLVPLLVAGVVVLASQVGALADAGPRGPATTTGTGGTSPPSTRWRRGLPSTRRENASASSQGG